MKHILFLLLFYPAIANAQDTIRITCADTTLQKLFYDESSGPIMGYMVRVNTMTNVRRKLSNGQFYWFSISGRVIDTYFLDKRKRTRISKPLYVN